MDKVIKNKRGLELVTSVSSGHETSSEKLHLARFDDWSFGVIPKITPSNLYMSIHDIINYSTSICPLEFGKCGEKGKKSQKIKYLESERSFSDEMKNFFRSF